MRTTELIRKTSTSNTSSLPGRSIRYIVLHYTAGTSSYRMSVSSVKLDNELQLTLLRAPLVPDVP